MDAEQDHNPPGDEVLDLDSALAELDDADAYFPTSALGYCQQHREAVVPRLIAILEEATRLGREGLDRYGAAPFYAVFLLNEFRAKDALPALVDFLRLPGELLSDLLLDAKADVVARTLAVLADDRLDALDSLIEDRTVDEIIRWDAASAYVHLVHDGQLGRDTAIERLRDHLRRATKANDRDAATFLVQLLCDLNANDARHEMEEAFRRGVVNTWMICAEDMREMLIPEHPDSCPAVQIYKPAHIDDTVEELRCWHWPTDESDEDESNDDGEWEDDWKNLYRAVAEDRGSWDELGEEESDDLALGWGDMGGDLSVEPYEPPQPQLTVRHEGPRVGRNDPCPCGSGKKYKKCCMRNSDLLD
jgi:hypothetical protein